MPIKFRFPNLEIRRALNQKSPISCKEYPSDFILDKNLAKDYFRQFGKLKRVIFKSKSRICTVEYEDEEGFQNALRNAGEYNGVLFSLSAAHGSPERKRKKSVKCEDPIWVDKDEVQAELEAMSGTTENYNLPAESTISLHGTEIPGRSPKLKRVWQSEETGKNKKKIKVLESQGTVISAEQMDLVNLILSQAVTAEDKYRILDARDKLLRIKLKKKSVYLKSSPTVGTCPDMCPEKERMMREAQHQVALYEQEDSSRSMNQCKAVKQYSRSSADQETPLSHELRPVPVLQMTMSYLLHNIVDLCDTDEVNLAEWFHFLWDRTRGIRKDITQQELCCQGAVELVEQCARFHIHCSARLVAEEPSVFDQKINTENLTKCLQTLKYMYHDLLLEGESCPNEAEFRAYIILLNISDGNFMWEVQQLHEDIQKSVEVKYALDVYSAIDKNNYVKFFKLVYSTSYLNACILMRYFMQVRIAALKTLLRCYLPRSSRTTFPLIEFKNLLAFDDIESTLDFIQTYGLCVNEENTHIVLEKNKFAAPDFPYVLDRSLNVVEAKRSFSVGRVICGKELGSKTYEDHVPQNSFDRNGFLVSKDILEESELEQAKFKLLEELKCEIISSDEDSRKKPIIPASRTVSKKEDSSSSNIFEQRVDVAPTSYKSSQCIFVNPQKEIVPAQSQYDFSHWNKDCSIPVTITSIPTNIFAKPFKLQAPENATTKDDEKLSQKKDMPQASSVNPESNMEIAPTHNPVDAQKKLEEQTKQLEYEREKLERIRTEKERELSEAKRREDRLEEELRKEETAKHFEIKKAVEDTIVSMLDQVHNGETLAKIRTSIQRRAALEAFKTWHNIVLKNKRKRRALECSPAWINARSFAQCAEELHVPSQNLALGLAKRYKQGKPLDIGTIRDETATKINIVELTYSVLTSRLHELTGKFQKNIFWKVAVSLPDEQELEQGLETIENLLSSVFQWEQRDGGTFVVEHDESMTYCVEKQQSDFVSKGDADGIIFVAKNFSRHLQRRILENLQAYGTFTTIPIVIILQNYNNSDDLDELLKHKVVSECVVLETLTPHGLPDAIEEALVLLAKKVEKHPPLELDTLHNFVFTNLCSEIWKRANSFAKWNLHYAICLQDPNVVIQLYNEGLEKLKKIVLKESLQQYAVFPKTFRKYLDSELPDFLPCHYQYFPEFLSSPNYKKQLEQILLELELPYWQESWPCLNELELEKNILKYCCKTFGDPQTVFYKVMSVVLRTVDTEADFDETSKVLWTDLIEVLAVEKLKEVNVSLKNTEFENESIFNQFIVIYDIRDLERYNSSDWFYIHNPVVKSFIHQLLKENANQQTERIPIDDLETLEETFNESVDQLSEQNQNPLQVKEELAHLNYLLQDLETSMRIHKKISSVLSDNLQKANNDN